MSTTRGIEYVCRCICNEKNNCYEIFIWEVIESYNWKVNLSQHKNHHAALRLTHSYVL